MKEAAKIITMGNFERWTVNGGRFDFWQQWPSPTHELTSTLPPPPSARRRVPPPSIHMRTNRHKKIMWYFHHIALLWQGQIGQGKNQWNIIFTIKKPGFYMVPCKYTRPTALGTSTIVQRGAASSRGHTSPLGNLESRDGEDLNCGGPRSEPEPHARTAFFALVHYSYEECQTSTKSVGKKWWSTSGYIRKRVVCGSMNPGKIPQFWWGWLFANTATSTQPGPLNKLNSQLKKNTTNRRTLPLKKCAFPALCRS